ncbi:hypothetical protein HAX54_020196 [Datura stramonium]|uniref:Uncharacterized protein n=1 Tax=Datura stramonium TaxID=4076 RepID=A0ABS8UQL1_DATST|nr:hypothetical protein [Datura stramonium]
MERRGLEQHDFPHTRQQIPHLIQQRAPWSSLIPTDSPVKNESVMGSKDGTRVHKFTFLSYSDCRRAKGFRLSPRKGGEGGSFDYHGVAFWNGRDNLIEAADKLLCKLLADRNCCVSYLKIEVVV